MRTTEPAGRWSWRAFGVALGVTVLLLAVVLAGAVQWAVAKKARDVRRGWTLVPVLVFTHDLKAGAVLRAGDVMVAEVPEMMQTASALPLSAQPGLTGRVLQGEAARGDVVWQQHFQPRPDVAGCYALASRAARKQGVAQEAKVQAWLDAVRARTEAGHE